MTEKSSIDANSSFPPDVRVLVDRFEADIDHYRSGLYMETELREDFLNPVFEALGWDVLNKARSAFAKREVLKEQSIRIEGQEKAPDYTFLVDGIRKFFVEAKRPAVLIKERKEAAFQIRRYCWSAGLPFGIVSDFEEFAIYDCRAVPDPYDSVHVGRLHYFRFEDLQEKWPLLVELFGKKSVAGGSLERFAATQEPPVNTRAIDDAFLEEIRSWRTILAADIAKRNADLDVVDLNSAVQALIDRLIFLRIAEARQFETYKRLAAASDSQVDTYKELLRLFKRADDRYNSGLFHFGKGDGADQIAPTLKVAPDLLDRIIKRLYYPEPYEFSVLPADILGRIYEQFLGEVVKIGPDRRTTVETKPEVRKSGGVYYTPEPVVKYIVEETVGPLLEGKTPAEVATMRILDPACGSGSFLIAVFQYLVDWHREYYADRPTLARKFLEEGSDGQVRLNIRARKEILNRNVFGVDIDPQAVEVTKLSLLLKVIEGHSQMELELGRILPDLDANIVCGNSLIGLDFPMPLALDRIDALQFNPFSWDDAFPAIMRSGGFHAVVGNPPYLNIDNVWGKKDPRLAYIKSAYSSVHTDKTDILFYFLKKSVDICQGEVGMIVSRSFLEGDKAQNLREWLSVNARIREVLDFREAIVFPKVGINTAIVRISKSRHTKVARFRRFLHKALPPDFAPQTLREAANVSEVQLPVTELGRGAWNFGALDVRTLMSKIDAGGTPVGNILHVGKGMETGANRSFIFESDEARVQQLTGIGQLYRRARNSDIRQYFIAEKGARTLYVEEATAFAQLPSDVKSHLETERSALEARAAYQRGDCEWWKFTWPLHKDFFDRPRIFCPYRAQTNRFALDEGREFIGLTDTTVLYDNEQAEDLRYILAVLNSRTLTARFRFIGKLIGGGNYEYYENTVTKLPIPRRVPGDPDHDRLVDLVVKLETATGVRNDAIISSEIKELDAEIESLDDSIEGEVYNLFDLSHDDVELLKSQN